MLRYRYPYVCMDYQEGGCALGDTKCSNLHVCYFYKVGKCKKQEGVCAHKHESALEGEQGLRLMKEFNLTSAEFRHCVLLPERKKVVAVKNTDKQGSILTYLLFVI